LARLFNRINESDCNGPVLQVWPREYAQHRREVDDIAVYPVEQRSDGLLVRRD